MKKNKLLVLLALPMLLAACGGKDNSGIDSSNEIESSILNSDDTSSSENIEKEQTEEEALAIIANSLKEMDEAHIAFTKNKKSFTEETESHDIFHDRMSKPVDGGVISMVLDDNYDDIDWRTISYNKDTNVGYYKADNNYREEDGSRSTFRTEWYLNVDGEYRKYNSQYQEYEITDENHPWFEATKSSLYKIKGDPFIQINSLKSLKSVLYKEANGFLANYANKDTGTYEAKTSFKSKLEEKDGVKSFVMDVETKVTLKAEEIPTDLGEDTYLLSHEMYKVDTIEAIYTKDNILEYTYVSKEGSNYESITSEGKTTRTISSEGTQKTVMKDGYEDIAFPDATEYKSAGVTSINVNFISPSGKISNTFGNYMGYKLAWKDSYILDEQAINEEVTISVYLDKEHTRKIENNELVLPAEDLDLYYVVNVPEDKAYVYYEFYGVALENKGSGIFNRNLTASNSFVGSGSDGWCISAITLIDKYFEGETKNITLATYSAELIYSTDKDAEVIDEIQIDIKNGNYYEVRYMADQVA